MSRAVQEVLKLLGLLVGIGLFLILAFLIEGCVPAKTATAQEEAAAPAALQTQQLTEEDFILATEIAMNQAEQEGWEIVGVDSRSRLLWIRKPQESEQRPWMVRYWRLQPAIDAVMKAREKQKEEGGE